MKMNLQAVNVGGFPFEFFRTIGYQATGGGELGECLAVMGRIKDGDMESWIEEWAGLAGKVAKEADALLTCGETVSARGAYLRASNYYRAAEFFTSSTNPQQLELWGFSRKCFQSALPFLPHTVESISIPFEGSLLPGYFVHGGEGRRPTLLAVSGFDGSAEELYHLIGAAAAEHGWHCLIFEGPGQRGALHLNPLLVFRGDYEKPVGAVVDYALERPDVDGNRLAIIGYSMGGYLAPRAAAYEPRIKACIANPFGADCATSAKAAFPGFLQILPKQLVDWSISTLTRFNTEIRWAIDHSRWAFGMNHPADFFHEFSDYNLWGSEKFMKASLLCVIGENDEAITVKEIVQDNFNYINNLDSPVDILFYGKKEGLATHCQIMGGLLQAQTATFQWLNQVLPENGVESARNSMPRVNVPDTFLEAIEKRHGKDAAVFWRAMMKGK